MLKTKHFRVFNEKNLTFERIQIFQTSILEISGILKENLNFPAFASSRVIYGASYCSYL